ncbi:MAG: glutamate racemase [Bacteroidales bacterium]|nr:glutamate racemase [Bacteroidales bacterium]
MTLPHNIKLPTQPGPIGVFDSGYGGLTILRDLRRAIPDADYLYLGDNARAPYGSRSFELVYRFTLDAVTRLFAEGCHLVILACNTASAKALRTIQQNDLGRLDPSRRVLGVIRPTVEALGRISRNGHIGLLGTPGTVASGSYDIEIAKLYPDFTTTARPCPMWVPLVENREADGPGADYFVRKYIDGLMEADPQIDTIILGCTHYPLLIDKIRRYVPDGVTILSQGSIVADSLTDYLRRHPEIDTRITRGGVTGYLTTEQADRFADQAALFMGTPVTAHRVEL